MDKVQPPKKKAVTKSMLLTCPEFGKGNSLIRETTALALCDYLLNLTDTDCNIDDEWYYYLLREQVYGSGDDDLIFIPGDNEQEKWEFMRDPHSALWYMGREVDRNLNVIVEYNEEKINQLYQEVIAHTIDPQRYYNNHLMLLIKGIDHDDAISFRPNPRH